MRVAKAVTVLYSGDRAAAQAEEAFVAAFQKHVTPIAIPEVRVENGELLGAALLRAGSVASNNEFRRLISAGAISEINGPTISDPHFIIRQPLVLKIGKHRFLRINF